MSENNFVKSAKNGESKTSSAVGGGQMLGQRQKKSSFQITSVTATRMSNDGGEDSADDLDESHTEDISDVIDNSRVTDVENETPSYSEDTFSKDDVFFNASSTSLGTAPVIPTSSQYGLAIVPQSNSNVVSSDTTDIINITKSADENDPHVTRNERFKVVKIESTEPFKRGRWQCMDYLDHTMTQTTQPQQPLPQQKEEIQSPVVNTFQPLNDVANEIPVVEEEHQYPLLQNTISPGQSVHVVQPIPQQQQQQVPVQTQQQSAIQAQNNMMIQAQSLSHTNVPIQQIPQHQSLPPQQIQQVINQATFQQQQQQQQMQQMLHQQNLQQYYPPNTQNQILGQNILQQQQIITQPHIQQPIQNIMPQQMTHPIQYQLQQQLQQNYNQQLLQQMPSQAQSLGGYVIPQTNQLVTTNQPMQPMMMQQPISQIQTQPVIQTQQPQQQQQQPQAQQPPQQQPTLPPVAAKQPIQQQNYQNFQQTPQYATNVVPNNQNQCLSIPNPTLNYTNQQPAQNQGMPYTTTSMNQMAFTQPIMTQNRPPPQQQQQSQQQTVVQGQIMKNQQQSVLNPNVLINQTQTLIGQSVSNQGQQQQQQQQMSQQQPQQVLQQPQQNASNVTVLDGASLEGVPGIQGVPMDLQGSVALLESLVEVTASGEQIAANDDAESASGTSAVAIDNKIEQAMDLVKSHLMFAVREEVEVLKEKIAELMDRINQLEVENTILKQNATQETLAQLTTQKSQQQQQQTQQSQQQQTQQPPPPSANGSL